MDCLRLFDMHYLTISEPRSWCWFKSTAVYWFFDAFAVKIYSDPIIKAVLVLWWNLNQPGLQGDYPWDLRETFPCCELTVYCISSQHVCLSCSGSCKLQEGVLPLLRKGTLFIPNTFKVNVSKYDLIDFNNGDLSNACECNKTYTNWFICGILKPLS